MRLREFFTFGLAQEVFDENSPHMYLICVWRGKMCRTKPKIFVLSEFAPLRWQKHSKPTQLRVVLFSVV